MYNIFRAATFAVLRGPPVLHQAVVLRGPPVLHQATVPQGPPVLHQAAVLQNPLVLRQAVRGPVQPVQPRQFRPGVMILVIIRYSPM